ncbi:MAG: T9SS type A sorting domain-containing protein [Candidatus Krumholzibacteriia bacterium]
MPTRTAISAAAKAQASLADSRSRSCRNGATWLRGFVLVLSLVLGAGAWAQSTLYTDDFSDNIFERWETTGGTWSEHDGVLRGTERGEAIIGDPDWDVTRVSADVYRSVGTDVYLILKNATSYIHANLRGGSYQDIWVSDGVDSHSVPFANLDQQWYRLELVVHENSFDVIADGTVLATFTLRGGAAEGGFFRCGLGLWGADDGTIDDSFDNVAIAGLGTPSTLFHDDFGDAEIVGWNVDRGAWSEHGGRLDGEGLGELITGNLGWEITGAAADVYRTSGTDVYIILRNATTLIHANLRGGSYQDIWVHDGEGDHSIPFPNANQTWYRLELAVHDVDFDVIVDGAVLETFPLGGDAARHGFDQFGLGLWGNYAENTFDNATVDGFSTGLTLAADQFEDGQLTRWQQDGGIWSEHDGYLEGLDRGELLTSSLGWTITRAGASVYRESGTDVYVILRNDHTFIHANLRGGSYQDIWTFDGLDYHSIPFANENQHWYRLALAVHDAAYDVVVDDVILATFPRRGEAATSSFKEFGLGLWGDYAENRFDNAFAMGTRHDNVLHVDNFQDNQLSPWNPESGMWSEHDGYLEGNSQGEILFAAGEADIVRAAVDVYRAAGTDVYITLKNADGFIHADLRSGSYQDIWVHDGESYHSVIFANTSTQWYRLELAVRETDFDVMVDGITLATFALQGPAADRGFTKFGLATWGEVTSCRFDEALIWGYREQPIPVSVEPPSAVRALVASARPNPFNPRTEIRFQMAEAGLTWVAVFDARGRLVRQLVRDTRLEAGPNAVVWNGTDDSGRRVASGVYFYRITTPQGVAVGKVALAK